MDILTREGIIAAAIITLLGCRAPAPETPEALLERSLDAMGVARLAEPNEGFLFEAEGTFNQGVENQGTSLGSLGPSDFRESLALDVSGARVAYEYQHDRMDGRLEWIREIFHDNERTIVVRSDNFVIRLQSEDQVFERENLSRRFPHILLREALAAGVRAAAADSDSDGDGSPLAFDVGTGETLVLSLDSETSLLTRVDYRTDIQSLGDSDVSWHFEDYRPVEGFGLFPHAYRVMISGRPFLEMQLTGASVDPAVRSELFDLPDGMMMPEEIVQVPAGDASSRAQVETLAPGIHRVRNLRPGFNPMFVELDDGVVAFDAPAGYRLLTQLPAGEVAPGPSSAWFSERYIELIEETVPDKPIRYVVLTHFHNDHAGGLRAFVAKGVTLVGHESIRTAVEELVSRPHTIAPDALASQPRELLFEGVSGSHSLGGGIEIIEVGDNPHSEALLAIHIPRRNILFTSDLTDLEGFFPDWLEAQGLTGAIVYAMHAGEPVVVEREGESS